MGREYIQKGKGKGKGADTKQVGCWRAKSGTGSGWLERDLGRKERGDHWDMLGVVVWGTSMGGEGGGEG
jgi:hypothetical protein